MGLDLKQIEEVIKKEKMDNVIQDYCETVGDVYGIQCQGHCIIEEQCTATQGDFVREPQVLEEAYKIVTEHNEKKSDTVNHPSHYNEGMECIDEMILIFGKTTVANFCLCNAWKYRYRALYKNGEEDMKKSHWYIAKYKELIEDEYRGYEEYDFE